MTQEYLAAILAGMAGNTQPQQTLPLLSEILTPQNLVPLLEGEAVKKRLGELIEHMPPQHQAEAAQQARLTELKCSYQLLSFALSVKDTDGITQTDGAS